MCEQFACEFRKTLLIKIIEKHFNLEEDKLIR